MQCITPCAATQRDFTCPKGNLHVVDCCCDATSCETASKGEGGRSTCSTIDCTAAGALPFASAAAATRQRAGGMIADTSVERVCTDVLGCDCPASARAPLLCFARDCAFDLAPEDLVVSFLLEGIVSHPSSAILVVKLITNRQHNNKSINKQEELFNKPQAALCSGYLRTEFLAFRLVVEGSLICCASHVMHGEKQLLRAHQRM